MEPTSIPPITPEPNVSQSPLGASPSQDASSYTPPPPDFSLPRGTSEKLLPPQSRNSWGAIVGIAIIIIVLIVGALYFWGAKLSEEDGFLPDAETPTQESAAIQFQNDKEALK